MAELRIIEQPLPGLFLLNCPYFPDQSGDFTKLFHSEALHSQGISFMQAESFLTRSKRNVLRGMHFQVGHSAHEKLVTCIKGSFLMLWLISGKIVRRLTSPSPLNFPNQVINRF